LTLPDLVIFGKYSKSGERGHKHFRGLKWGGGSYSLSTIQNEYFSTIITIVIDQREILKTSFVYYIFVRKRDQQYTGIMP
jgi:hypothetical protein